MHIIKTICLLLLALPHLQVSSTSRHKGQKEVFIALFTGATGSSATGVPAIADQLRTTFNAIVRVYGYSETGQAKKDIEQRIGQTGNEQVILIGHSYGGNAVLEFVKEHGNSYKYYEYKREEGERPNVRGWEILIDYAITIDPYGSNDKLSWNVPGYNFYTTYGETVSGRLVHGKNIAGKYMENKDYTNLIHSCSQGQNHRYTHTNIDDCEGIITAIIEKVRARITGWPF